MICTVKICKFANLGGEAFEREKFERETSDRDLTRFFRILCYWRVPTFHESNGLTNLSFHSWPALPMEDLRAHSLKH